MGTERFRADSKYFEQNKFIKNTAEALAAGANLRSCRAIIRVIERQLRFCKRDDQHVPRYYIDQLHALLAQAYWKKHELMSNGRSLISATIPRAIRISATHALKVSDMANITNPINGRAETDTETRKILSEEFKLDDAIHAMRESLSIYYEKVLTPQLDAQKKKFEDYLAKANRYSQATGIKRFTPFYLFAPSSDQRDNEHKLLQELNKPGEDTAQKINKIKKALLSPDYSKSGKKHLQSMLQVLEQMHDVELRLKTGGIQPTHHLDAG